MTTQGEINVKAMLISLGGTSAPLIESLNTLRPKYICFLVSNLTKNSINEVIDKLNYKPDHHDWIETPDPENFPVTYGVLRDKIEEILQKWGVSYDEIAVDYTGGTKSMSVAIVLSTIEKVSKYCYIGGTERTNGGTGKVRNGKEVMKNFVNPWTELAVLKRKEINLLFNRGIYSSALEIAKEIVPKVGGDLKSFFQWICSIIEAYDAWDKFDHKTARNLLMHSLKEFYKLYPHQMPPSDKNIKIMVNHMDKNAEFLNKLITCKSDQEKEWLKILDLIANAKRRVIEGKYDDAVARLYRSVEAFAHYRLTIYGINASAVDLSKLEDKIEPFFLNYYIQKYSDETGKIKLGLYASYEMLNKISDEAGKSFFENEELKNLLKIRNDSILAHGYETIEEGDCYKMINHVLSLTGIKESDLPEFPEFAL